MKCIDCLEEMGHAGNQGRCRDCDIEHAFESSRCPHCGWWQTNGHLFPQQTHDPMGNCPWMAL